MRRQLLAVCGSRDQAMAVVPSSSGQIIVQILHSVDFQLLRMLLWPADLPQGLQSGQAAHNLQSANLHSYYPHHLQQQQQQQQQAGLRYSHIRHVLASSIGVGFDSAQHWLPKDKQKALQHINVIFSLHQPYLPAGRLL